MRRASSPQLSVPVKRVYHILVTMASALRASMRDRKARLAFMISGSLYSLAYMASTGILVKASPALDPRVLIDFKTVDPPSLGGFPSLLVIIGGELMVSISLPAAAFLVLLSALIASNTSILVYAYHTSRAALRAGGGRVIAASTPAMFTSFGCAVGCGGGLSAALVSYITGAGAAGVYASVLASWGWVLSALSVMLLLWTLYRVSKFVATPRGGRSLRFGYTPQGCMKKLR